MDTFYDYTVIHGEKARNFLKRPDSRKKKDSIPSAFSLFEAEFGSFIDFDLFFKFRSVSIRDEISGCTHGHSLFFTLGTPGYFLPGFFIWRSIYPFFFRHLDWHTF